jgi:hypothetical protein
MTKASNDMKDGCDKVTESTSRSGPAMAWPCPSIDCSLHLVGIGISRLSSATGSFPFSSLALEELPRSWAGLADEPAIEVG